MENRRCPKCAATGVVTGRIERARGEGGGGWAFVPIGTRAMRLNIGVALPAEYLACASCGLVWTSTVPAEIRSFIEKYGTEVGRQHFKSLECGPDHGVPDIPEARQAAERASEIDALVLVGQRGPATRWYRQWTGCTWHDAQEALRSWHRLKRAQKLALLGWAPKEPKKAEKTEPAGHPMRDRLLDG